MLGFVADLRQRLDGLGGPLQLADELGLLQRGGWRVRARVRVRVRLRVRVKRG